MSRSAFALPVALLWTALPLGCGARTTLDQEDYLEGGAISGRGGNTSGGSTAGGQGAIGANGGGAGVVMGGAPAGGVTGTGGTSAGGSVSVGGTIGVGGKAGYQITMACESFCGPYSASCPEEAGGQAKCTFNCLNEFANGPPHCRNSAIDALHCLADNFDLGLLCNDALVNAYNACADLVQAAQACSDGSAQCTGTTDVTPVDCTSTLMCSASYYSVYCYRIDQTLTNCDCTSDFESSSFTSDVPLESACGYAMELCGYPP